jgi:hypothetical protein
VAWTICALGAGLAVNALITFLPSKDGVATSAPAGAAPPTAEDAAVLLAAAPLSPRAMIQAAVEGALGERDDHPDAEPRSHGHSLSLVLTFEPPTRARDNYVFDTEDTRGTRVSLYMTPDDVLTYRVADRARTEMVQVHQGPDTFAFGRPTYVACAYGSSRTDSFLRLRIGGREVQYRKTERLTVIDPKASFSFGADVRGSHPGAFDFSGWYVIKATTPSTEEERQMLEQKIAAAGLDDAGRGD